MKNLVSKLCMSDIIGIVGYLAINVRFKFYNKVIYICGEDFALSSKNH